MEDPSNYFRKSEVSDIKGDIRVLQNDQKTLYKRVDWLESKSDNWNQLSNAISVMSVTLEHIVEHNKKQDKRQDEQDGRAERTNETLERINSSLVELTQSQTHLNRKVGVLEERVDNNENKHVIDTRDISTTSYRNILMQYGVPAGVGAGILYIILELIQAFK